ncbi:MAG: VOC family protein [Chloroflexota bacterium]
MTDDPGENDPMAPELFVPDVNAAIKFYASLGFSLQRREPETGEYASFAIVRPGAAMIMLVDDRYYSGARVELEHRGGGVDIRIIVDDVDATYAIAKSTGMTVLNEIADRDYGLRDFTAGDPNGFRLRFASPLP